MFTIANVRSVIKLSLLGVSGSNREGGNNLFAFNYLQFTILNLKEIPNMTCSILFYPLFSSAQSPYCNEDDICFLYLKSARAASIKSMYLFNKKAISP
jgi:hypothetical protein